MQEHTNSAILVFGCVLVLTIGGFYSRTVPISLGQIDSANQYSSVGAILIFIPQAGTQRICSGTLIGKREFLTAGYCSEYLAWNIKNGSFALKNIKVSFDPLDATQPDHFWDVQAIVTHPDFDPDVSSPFADIGFIILTEESGIEPAVVASVGFLDDLMQTGAMVRGLNRSVLEIAGYGSQLGWVSPEFDPEHISRTSTKAVFQSLASDWLIINLNPIIGSQDKCFTDTGGATFWESIDKDRILVGVNSRIGGGRCNSSGYATRVDQSQVHDFIEAVLEQY
jgi:hypothetical protein